MFKFVGCCQRSSLQRLKIPGGNSLKPLINHRCICAAMYCGKEEGKNSGISFMVFFVFGESKEKTIFRANLEMVKYT